jgi:hypothetical protein
MPGTKRIPACSAATIPRTSPATELRSAIPIAGMPSALAVETISRGWEAPSRKVKFDSAPNSANMAHSRPCTNHRAPAPKPDRQTQSRAPFANSTR